VVFGFCGVSVGWFFLGGVFFLRGVGVFFCFCGFLFFFSAVGVFLWWCVVFFFLGVFLGRWGGFFFFLVIFATVPDLLRPAPVNPRLGGGGH